MPQAIEMRYQAMLDHAKGCELFELKEFNLAIDYFNQSQAMFKLIPEKDLITMDCLFMSKNDSELARINLVWGHQNQGSKFDALFNSAVKNFLPIIKLTEKNVPLQQDYFTHLINLALLAEQVAPYWPETFPDFDQSLLMLRDMLQREATLSHNPKIIQVLIPAIQRFEEILKSKDKSEKDPFYHGVEHHWMQSHAALFSSKSQDFAAPADQAAVQPKRRGAG